MIKGNVRVITSIDWETANHIPDQNPSYFQYIGGTEFIGYVSYPLHVIQANLKTSKSSVGRRKSLPTSTFQNRVGWELHVKGQHEVLKKSIDLVYI